MAEKSGFPYAEIRYDTAGHVVDASERAAALAMAATPAITDVLVISHGWNNNMADARALYARIATSLRSVLDAGKVPGFDGRSLAIIGVLWPSMKFADSDLIPGGAAAVASGPDSVRQSLDALADFLDDDAARAALAEARGLVDELETSPSAQAQFADLVRSALTADAGDDDDEPDASEAFFAVDGELLMTRLAAPTEDEELPPTALGETGGAAGLGDLLGGVWDAAKKVLNCGTYYEMKARAGTIGTVGVAPLLADLRADDQRPQSGSAPLRIHLAGHSFGARVVTAAAGAGSKSLPLDSMALLQAAFSHYGFAQGWETGKNGAFRGVLTTHRVTGPAMVTYTKNDKAVGLAYAIASQVAGQVGSALGDATDKYGGLGRNGALKTPEAKAGKLLAVGQSYVFAPAAIHNLLADEFVSSHGDVDGKEVAYAMLTSMATT